MREAIKYAISEAKKQIARGEDNLAVLDLVRAKLLQANAKAEEDRLRAFRLALYSVGKAQLATLKRNEAIHKACVVRQLIQDAGEHQRNAMDQVSKLISEILIDANTTE